MALREFTPLFNPKVLLGTFSLTVPIPDPAYLFHSLQSLLFLFPINPKPQK